MNRCKENIWLCEYSALQNYVHVMSLDTAVEVNLRQVLEGGAGDWIPVGAFDTPEEAGALADALEVKLGIFKEDVG